MRVVAMYNRHLQKAIATCKYAGLDPVEVSTQRHLDATIESGRTAVSEDAFLIAHSEHVDVLVETTGSVEFGSHVILEAFKHGKDVVLLNAEIDATLGPILHTYAAKYGVVLSACEGDEPGVQINLYRWVKGLGKKASLKSGGKIPRWSRASRMARRSVSSRRSSRMRRVSSSSHEVCHEVSSTEAMS
jgi:predicted homoserine dehydrogenase-like protein